MFPQASAFLVFDPMFAFGHGIHIKAKTERKTGTFTASEQCLLQVTSVINTQHNSNLELCSLQKNRATQKQVVNLELTKSLFATGDEMLTSYSRCHAKKCADRGKKCYWPALEDEVAKWVTEQRQDGYIEKTFTPAGNMRAASLTTVCEWVKDTWQNIPSEMVVRSFKKVRDLERNGWN